MQSQDLKQGQADSVRQTEFFELPQLSNDADWRTAQGLVRMTGPAIDAGTDEAKQLIEQLLHITDQGAEEIRAVIAVLLDGALDLGPVARTLAQTFIQKLGGKYCVPCGSGTQALELSLRANRIGRGDEVIVPSLAWAGVVNAVAHTGATPVFADVQKGTLNIAVEEISRLCSSKTKAVVPIHFAGLPVDMKPIYWLASKKGFVVIQDSALALGAKYKGQTLNSLSRPDAGDCAIYSFCPTKIVTAGAGGALSTNNNLIASEVESLSQQGMTVSSCGGSFPIRTVGHKFNLPDILAAIANAQLQKLDAILERKAEIAKFYRQGLDDLQAKERLRMQLLPTSYEHVHANAYFPILVKNQVLTAQSLYQLGVQAGMWKALHLEPIYLQTYAAKHLPVAEEAGKSLLFLPNHMRMQNADISKVIEALHSVLK